jgi:hypothetical protein
MEITKEIVKAMRDDINAALAAVSKKYNVTLKAGNASYEAHLVKFKLEWLANSADGKAVDKQAVALQKYGYMYGITPNMAGKTFKVGGNVYTLVGLQPTRTKRPIIGSRTDGKRFIFGTDVIKLIAK